MTDLEVVQKFYDALNRGDVDGVVALLDPAIVRVEFEEHPNGGTYRGIEEVRAHVAKGRGTWAEGACEPEEVLTRGSRFVVSVHVRVRLLDATEWLEGHVTDAFELRGGKLVEFRSFTHRADALKWAEG